MRKTQLSVRLCYVAQISMRRELCVGMRIQNIKNKVLVNRNCIYIGVKFFLHGYMFRLVANHLQVKERNDLTEQLYCNCLGKSLSSLA
jgi:hypothetical protein